MRMLTDTPASKVNAATLAAAVTTLVLYLLKVYVIKDGPDLPVPVELAIGVLITAAVTFVAGYFTPPAGRDQVVDDRGTGPEGGLPPTP